MASMSFRLHTRALCAFAGLAAIASTCFGAAPGSSNRIDTIDRCADSLIFAPQDHAGAMVSVDRAMSGPADASTSEAVVVEQMAVPTDIGESPAGVSPFPALGDASLVGAWTTMRESVLDDGAIVARELSSPTGAYEPIALPASVAASLLALDNLTTIMATPN